MKQLVCILLCLQAGSLIAQKPPSCPTPSGIVRVNTLEKLPASVRQSVTFAVAGIVDSTEGFDSTYFVQYDPPRFNRFAFHRLRLRLEHAANRPGVVDEGT